MGDDNDHIGPTLLLISVIAALTIIVCTGNCSFTIGKPAVIYGHD